MKLYYYFHFGDCVLKVPHNVSRFSQTRVRKNTPHSQFIFDHREDLICELNCVKDLAQSFSFTSYLEMMAGLGFSAKLVSSIQDLNEIWLNDKDEFCTTSLAINFANEVGKEIMITQSDVLDLKVVGRWDVIFIDFNTFSMKRWNEWLRLWGNVKGKFRNLWLTDTACYVWTKFGAQTFEKCFGFKSLEQYCQSFSNLIKSTLGASLRRARIGANGKCAILDFEYGYEGDWDLRKVDKSLSLKIEVKWGLRNDCEK